jgi:HicB family
MCKSAYPLRLPLSTKKAAQRLAKEDGVSLNQWIAVAVAEKVGVVETAAEFFKRRAKGATGKGLMKFLRAAPKLAPEAEDSKR